MKKYAQSIYVTFAFNSIFSFLFVDKRVSLPIALKGYAILGGNHRIRLFDNDKKFNKANLTQIYIEVCQFGKGRKFDFYIGKG